MSVVEKNNRFSDLMALEMPVFHLSVMDGEISFAGFNDVHMRMTGIDREALVGKRPHDVLPQRVADTVVENYQTCAQTRSVYRYEEQLDLASGAHWWDTTLTPYFDENGNVEAIVGIAMDITAKKEREFAVASELSAANNLASEMQIFASMAVHDVRGPLRKLDTLVELTLDGFDDPAGTKKTMLELSQGIVRGALSTIDSMLGYARALSTDEMPAQDVDLGHIVRDVIALADPDGRFEITYPKTSVTGETVVLQMILQNLVSNAVRFAKHRIVIETEHDAANETLTMFVSDDGAGFVGGAEGFQTMLRNAAATNTLNGFGLPAIKHLVAARKGRFSIARSRLGGATFAVTLPGQAIGFVDDRQINRETRAA